MFFAIIWYNYYGDNMINFIIVDDNEYVRNQIELIISKVCMPYDFNYKVSSFEGYNDEVNKVIKNDNDIKVYLLDIEMPKTSGVELARYIRKTDWDSIIIITTSHDELELNVLKEKLLIFDFISKFDDVEKRMSESLKDIIDKINNRKVLTIKSGKEVYNLKYDEILYLYKNNDMQTIITTINKDLIVRESLTTIAKRLDSRFYRTHRACYINKDKIEKVDFNNNIIYFPDKKNIDLLSRNYKKGLKDYVCK